MAITTTSGDVLHKAEEAREVPADKKAEDNPSYSAVVTPTHDALHPAANNDQPQVVPAAGRLARRAAARHQPLFQHGNVPMNAPQQENVNQQAYNDVVYNTENFFGTYIGLLFGEIGSQPDEAGTEAVILVRTLREAAIAQSRRHLQDSDGEDDPFFNTGAAPGLLGTTEDDEDISQTIPLQDYLRRFNQAHPNSSATTVEALYDLNAPGVMVGISSKPEYAGYHFIVLPEPEKLLEDLRNGESNQQ